MPFHLLLRCLLGVVVLFLAAAPPTRACTLWAVAHTVASKPTFTRVGKVRDSQLGHSEKVIHVQGGGRYSYTGLFVETEDPYLGFSPLKSGTNSAGLTIVYADAQTVPRAERWAQTWDPEWLHRLLTDRSSVDEVLQDLSSVPRPRLLLLADAKEIAHVEVGVSGQVAVRRTQSGHLVVTNHYQLLPQENRRPPTASSLERQQSVSHLLADHIGDLAALDETSLRIVEAAFRPPQANGSGTVSLWQVTTTLPDSRVAPQPEIVHRDLRFRSPVSCRDLLGL